MLSSSTILLGASTRINKNIFKSLQSTDYPYDLLFLRKRLLFIKYVCDLVSSSQSEKVDIIHLFKNEETEAEKGSVTLHR